jgi:hypothetical protein
MSDVALESLPDPKPPEPGAIGRAMMIHMTTAAARDVGALDALAT